MSRKNLSDLLARYATACDLKQAVDRDAITEALRTWMARIDGPKDMAVRFVVDKATVKDAVKAAREGWDMGAAWLVNVGRDPRAAWKARATRIAGNLRDARVASVAKDAMVRRILWGARDLSVMAITYIGAVSMNDARRAHTWEPIFTAFEAGCFAMWMGTDTIHAAPVPSAVRTDAGHRLHCADGPAFRWLDDITGYYWHGTSVPESWITDRESLTPQIALTWPNLEQRRAAVDILGGWGAVLDELPNKILDRDDPMTGTLVEVRLPGLSKPEKFLRVTCGTGREFGFCVPRHVKTAREAQAAIRGKTLADYLPPEIRT